jgi:hypothetical protein
LFAAKGNSIQHKLILEVLSGHILDMKVSAHYLIKLLLLMGLAFCACSQKAMDEISSRESTAYQIQLSDSVQIPYLGSPLIFDIDPDRSLVLFHDMQRNTNLLMDFDGNTLWEKSFSGDSPYNNGHFLSIASFIDSGFVFLGSRGVGLFDLEGNLLSQQRPSESFLVGFTILNQASKLEWKGDDWLYRFIHAGDFKSNEAGYYSNLTTLAFINKENGSVKYALPLPRESRLLDGKSYDNNDLTLFPTIKDGMLWAVFGGDTKLYKYAFDNLNQALSQTEINYPKFNASKGIPLSERNPNTFSHYGNSAQNELLRTDGKHLILVYRPVLAKMSWIYWQIMEKLRMRRRKID